MTSVSLYRNSSTAIGVDFPHAALRMRLLPRTAATGSFDGGWWPRSEDPAVEFPAMLMAVSVRMGPIDRVVFHPDEWPTTPLWMFIGGRLVWLDGMESTEAHTVTMTGAHGSRMVLLVVPPLASWDAAEAALATASARWNTGDARQILAGCGVITGQPRVAAERVRCAGRRPRVRTRLSKSRS